MSTPPTIKVKVSPASVISVQGSSSNKQRVDTITYGSRSLKSAYDLDLTNAANGGVLIYNSNNQTFFTSQITSNSISITDIDGGHY